MILFTAPCKLKDSFTTHQKHMFLIIPQTLKVGDPIHIAQKVPKMIFQQ